MVSSENASSDFAEGKYKLEDSIVVIQKDSKYAWFVCFCCFTSQLFILGVLHAFGVFYVEFLQCFGSSKAEAAWIGSLAYGISMTFCPITIFLLNRYGYRLVMVTGGLICAMSVLISSFVKDLPLMFFTFSVLYGIGTSMATQPTITIASDYFNKYLIFAVCVTMSGGSFGTLIIYPLSQALIDSIGWRNIFRFFAGTCTLTALLDFCIKPPQTRGWPHAKNIFKSTSGRLLENPKLWKNRVFVVWVIAITCVMLGFYIPYVHLVSFSFDIGIPPEKGSFIMALFGGCTTCSRLMFGKIIELKFLNPLHMHQISMIVTGTAMMMLPLSKSLTGIIIYVVVVGLVDGCFVVLLSILTVTVVGLENAVVAWGIVAGVSSITLALGPPIAANIYDITGSYDTSFHCAGIPIIIGAIVLFMIPWAQRTSNANVLIQLERKQIGDPNEITNPNYSHTFEGTAEEVVDHHGVHVRTVCTSTNCVETEDRSTCTSLLSLLAEYSLDTKVNSTQPYFKEEELTIVPSDMHTIKKIPFVSPPNQNSRIGIHKEPESHSEGDIVKGILPTAENNSKCMTSRGSSLSSSKSCPPCYIPQTERHYETSYDSTALHQASTQVFDVCCTKSKSDSNTDLRSAIHPKFDHIVISPSSKHSTSKQAVLNQTDVVNESGASPLLSDDIEIIYVDGTRAKNTDEVFREVKSSRLYSPPRRISPPPRQYSPAGRFSLSPPRLISPAGRFSPSTTSTTKFGVSKQNSQKDSPLKKQRVETSLGRNVDTQMADQLVPKVTKGDERTEEKTKSSECTGRSVSYYCSDEEEDEADMFIHLFNDDVEDD